MCSASNNAVEAEGCVRSVAGDEGEEPEGEDELDDGVESDCASPSSRAAPALNLDAD